jgi:hypothetical protein
MRSGDLNKAMLYPELEKVVLVKARGRRDKDWECVRARVKEGGLVLSGRGDAGEEVVELGRMKQVVQCGLQMLEIAQDTAMALDSLDAFLQNRKHRYFVNMHVFEVVLHERSVLLAVQTRESMNLWISTLGKVFMQNY